MIRKIFITFLILTLINFIFSCSITSDQTISRQELFIESGKIHAVVLNNAEKITFNIRGGRLVKRNNLIEGVSTKGNVKQFELNVASQLKWNDDNNNTQTGTPLQLIEYLSKIEKPAANDPFKNITITEIQSWKGDLYKFDENGAKFYKQKNYVYGLTNSLEPVEIKIEDILYAIVEKTNTAGSILATMGVIVGVIVVIGIIAMATKESCPFVYSYDGENYIFDAEPLGGATTKGLERTELSKLEHLKSDNNKYKLLVKNEVPETQYLNKMSLIIVDHNSDVNIYPDLNCNIHAVNSQQKAYYVKDEFGNSLTDFVIKEDDIFWQSHLPFDTTKFNNELRHKLIFAFPRPLDKKTARLVINAGTSLWGSQMIREMQSLYGNTIETWYEQIDREGIERDQMLGFVEREELYIMKAYVKEADKWVHKTSINGGGPFISETRVYDLDISGVKGDTLFIKFNLPYGFWTLNYLAIDYANSAPYLIKEINLSSAKDEEGMNIYSDLSNDDDQYHIMPNIGDYFYVEADSPPLNSNYKRTIFLKSSGYYKLHLDKEKPAQAKILYEIGSVPGAIVKYTLKCFNEWYSKIRNE